MIKISHNRESFVRSRAVLVELCYILINNVIRTSLV